MMLQVITRDSNNKVPKIFKGIMSLCKRPAKSTPQILKIIYFVLELWKVNEAEAIKNAREWTRTYAMGN